jgi:hypothetical protein
MIGASPACARAGSAKEVGDGIMSSGAFTQARSGNAAVSVLLSREQSDPLTPPNAVLVDGAALRGDVIETDRGWSLTFPSLATGEPATLELVMVNGLAAVELSVLGASELSRHAVGDPVVLGALNELNRAPGVRMQLDPAERVIRAQATLVSSELEDADVEWAVARLFEHAEKVRPVLLAAAAGALDRARALRHEIDTAVATAPPTLGSSMRRHVPTGREYLYACLVALALLAGVGYAVARYPHPPRGGPFVPNAAHAPVPAAILAGARDVPAVEAVLFTSFMSAASYRGALDLGAPGGPIWFVYGYDSKHTFLAGEAVDAQTGCIVFSRQRLFDTGAYTHLWYGWNDILAWVVGWAVTAISLWVLGLWAKSIPDRLAEAAAGETRLVRVWAHLRRLLWGLLWLLILSALALVIEIGVQTGDHAVRTLGYAASAILVLAWAYVSVGFRNSPASGGD